MKRLFTRVSLVGLLAGAVANAGVTLPQQVETADVLAWAGVILVGIAAIWPIKKLIALGNKS